MDPIIYIDGSAEGISASSCSYFSTVLNVYSDDILWWTTSTSAPNVPEIIYISSADATYVSLTRTRSERLVPSARLGTCTGHGSIHDDSSVEILFAYDHASNKVQYHQKYPSGESLGGNYTHALLSCDAGGTARFFTMYGYDMSDAVLVEFSTKYRPHRARTAFRSGRRHIAIWRTYQRNGLKACEYSADKLIEHYCGLWNPEDTV